MCCSTPLEQSATCHRLAQTGTDCHTLFKKQLKTLLLKRTLNEQLSNLKICVSTIYQLFYYYLFTYFLLVV